MRSLLLIVSLVGFTIYKADINKRVMEVRIEVKKSIAKTAIIDTKKKLVLDRPLKNKS
jgi:hypothetical protein